MSNDHDAHRGSADMPMPLEGCRVVDLTSAIGGAYCTKVLVDAGAEAVKLEDPSGDPLRRRSASGATIPADQDSAIFHYLAASKQSVVVDPDEEADVDMALRIIGDADIVVWTPGSRCAEHAALSPRALYERFPHLVVTAITPFGLDGPWAGRPASDLTLQAWSGGIWARGHRHRPPVRVGGEQDSGRRESPPRRRR